jgi:hypothetical protein
MTRQAARARRKGGGGLKEKAKKLDLNVRLKEGADLLLN